MFLLDERLFFARLCNVAQEGTLGPCHSVRSIPANWRINLLLKFDPATGAWGPANSPIRTTLDDRAIVNDILHGISPDYDLTPRATEQRDPTTGDHYYVAPIAYKTVSELKKTGTYVWANGIDASHQQFPTVRRLGKKEQINLSRSFFEFLNQHWPIIAASIQGRTSAPTTSQVPTGVAATTSTSITGHGYSQAPITWPEYKEMLTKMFGKDPDRATYALSTPCYIPDAAEEISRTYDCSEQAFNALEITLPPSYIRECSAQYNTIIHRAPCHDKLIIGCGNITPPREGVYMVHIDNYIGHNNRVRYRNDHKHPQFDTIDLQYAKNPTIVAEFGACNIIDLFGSRKYQEIIFEGLSAEGVIVSTPYAKKLLYELLADDGRIVAYDGVGWRTVINNKKELAD